MSRVVVTGASGFIGAALVRHLRGLGRPNVGIGRRATPEVDHVVNAYAADPLAALLREGDVVCHLAARAHRVGPEDDAEFHDNIRTTAALLQACYTRRTARLVFVSSIGVNGQRTQAAPFTELDEPAPGEPYARSKLSCERLVASASDSGGMDHVIVRPPLVYGPGAPGNFGRLARAVASGRPLPLGAIRNCRSFVAIANLVDFLTLCADHPAARNQTLLIADGEDLSTPQWIRRMAAAAGRPNACLVPVPELWLQTAGALLGRRAAVARVCDSLQVDTTLARARLGWSPPVSVDEGLRLAMAPFRTP